MKMIPIALAANLALAACGGASEQTPGNAAPPSGHLDASPADAANDDPVRLAEGGLQVVRDGTANLLEFGTPAPEATARLRAALAAAPEEAAAAGCRTLSWARQGGAGAASLDIHVKDGRFVGYHGGPGYRTADGIGFGSTRAEFEARYPSRVSGSDAAGQPVLTARNGIRAVAEGDGGDSGIVGVMAGENCPS